MRYLLLRGKCVPALFLLLSFFVGGCTCFGQILSYTSDAGGTLASVATNTTGTSLSRMNGASSPGAPCSSGYSAISFINTGIYSSVLPAIEVTVSPDAGFTLDVTGFTADMRRSASGPAKVRYAYSTDGGANWVDQGTDQSPNNGTCGATATGTWATSLSVSASSQLKFRIYGYNASSGSGVLQVLNLWINGTVSVSSGCPATSGLTSSVITSSSATIGWTAIGGATGYNVQYRVSGSATWTSASTATNSLNIAGLTPGTIYEYQVQTVCSAGMGSFTSSAFFTTNSAATSASSGKINIYFNTPVNNTVSTGVNAIYLHNIMADTLIAYLNRAQFTVDIAQYDYNQSSGFSSIANAVNACFTRGVRVRWIYDGSQSNTGLSLLNPGIHTLGSPTTSSYGIMHNKFVVIDANSPNPNDAVVSTGSEDWGVTQLNSAPNNILFIQDSALAHAYQNQFNMMWGGSGNLPDALLSKFGPDKTDLGAHIFTIGGKTIELYFSPSDHTDSHIQSCINSANTDLYFGVFTFTKNTDASAIVSRHAAGVYTPGIVDQNSTTGAAYPILTTGLGTLLKTFTGAGALVYHNKMVIVDPSNACSDPMVLTGSHNWTASADTKNDENTLIIHNDTIANIYYQSFYANYTALGGTITTITPCVVTGCGTATGLITTSVTTTTATLEWTSTAGAASYNIQYRIVGSATWSTATSAINSVTLIGLTPGIAYEVQVQVVCTTGTSGFSSPVTFTTAPATVVPTSCAIPTGLYDASTTGTTAILNWMGVPGAISYNIRYRITGTTAWNSATATANSVTITGLTPGLTYEYRVQAVCSATSQSAYSASGIFTMPGIASVNSMDNERLTDVTIYPNPAASEATIAYTLSSSTNVSISLYSVVGSKIIDLVTMETQAQGSHTGGFQLPAPGVYFVKITAAQFSATRKIIKL